VGEYVRLAKKLVTTRPGLDAALVEIQALGADYPIEAVLNEFARGGNAYEGWQE